MDININEIASAKIKAMEESGEIRKRIEDGVEKTVNEAIDSACKDYKFRSRATASKLIFKKKANFAG